MFSASPELSSDLDWMLLGDPASDELLARALCAEFFPSLYHLALVCLGQPEAAHQAALEALTSALLERDRYASGRWRQDFPAGRQARGDLAGRGVRLWVFSLALRRLDPHWPRTLPQFFQNISLRATFAPFWRMFFGLPDAARLGVCLHTLLGWPLEDISALLGIGRTGLRAALDVAASLAGRLAGAHKLGESLASERSALESVLRARWPAPQFQAADIEGITAEIGARVERHALRRLRLTRWKEIVWVGLAGAIITLLVWGLNQVLPEPEAGKVSLRTPTTQPFQVTSPVEPVALPEELSQLPDPNGAPRPDLYRVSPGETLEGIAQKLGTSPRDLLALNRLPPSAELKPGQYLLLPDSLARLGVRQPTPVLPQPLGPAIPAEASVQEVETWQAAARSHAGPLWVDARVLNFGPPGYIGPPQVARLQVWLSRDQLLLLYGGSQGGPQQVLLATRGGVYHASPATQPGWFFPVQGEDVLGKRMLSDLGLLIRLLRFQLASDRGLGWKIVDREKAGGQEALVLAGREGEETGRQKVWIDTHTGLGLRLQQYDERVPDTLAEEVILTQVDYQVNFPPELFDPRLPWRGGYARDASGDPLLETTGETNPLDRLASPWDLPEGHQRLLYLSPPPGFDPAYSQLAFQFSPGFNDQTSQTGVDLFAGGYFLGSLPFGNPWSLACARSADGQRLAYVSQPVRASRKNASLFWLDLHDPQHVQRPLGDIAVTQFAFSPDSLSLAAFGYDDQLSIGAIYQVDLETGRSQPLIHFQEVRSLAWSPEGDRLLVTGVRQTLTGLENLVVDPKTGEPAGTFSAGDPHYGLLKIGFPRPVGDLRNCVFPPAVY